MISVNIKKILLFLFLSIGFSFQVYGQEQIDDIQ
ncbi:MAG: hypothetical protein CFH33_01648, partial [Alphaproteobacteria bacterium MarineAlpha9_Bin3]